MELEPQIRFLNMPVSMAAEKEVRKKIDRLETFFPKITTCRVVITAPAHHHRKGGRFGVRIDIVVPGNELMVNRHPDEQTQHSDVYIAIRDAFNSAQRKLQDYARERRGQVKHHEERSPEFAYQEPIEGFLS